MDNFIAQVNETFSQVLEMRGPPPQRDSTNLTGMDIRQRIKDTRHNTRINKGDAVPVKYRLQELQIVEVRLAFPRSPSRGTKQMLTITHRSSLRLLRLLRIPAVLTTVA